MKADMYIMFLADKHCFKHFAFINQAKLHDKSNSIIAIIIPCFTDPERKSTCSRSYSKYVYRWIANLGSSVPKSMFSNYYPIMFCKELWATICKLNLKLHIKIQCFVCFSPATTTKIRFLYSTCSKRQKSSTLKKSSHRNTL